MFLRVDQIEMIDMDDDDDGQLAVIYVLGSTRALRARNSCHLVNQYLTFMTTLCSIFFPTFNILS
jgi:hypothetical protein